MLRRPLPFLSPTFLAFWLVAGMLPAPLAWAEEASKDEKEDSEKATEDKAKDEKKEKKKSIADLTEKSEAIDGLFRLYRDKETGKVRWLVRKDQLDREFLYFSQTQDGVVEGGHFRGAYAGAKVFRIRRAWERLEFVVENTGFWFDPASALARTKRANISPAVVASARIAAEDSKSGDVLVEAEGIFLAETFRPIKPIPPADEKEAAKRFALGKLSTEKTRFTLVKNYPKNTDLVVDYVFEEPKPVRPKGYEITDPRFVTISVRHTLIEAPTDDFVPRFEDPRIGLFTTRVTDLTSTSATPYRDLIHRWRLVKKDPAAAVSEPVEPIVWWIENTTPVELRETIRDAALTWNKAFLAAGFKNALRVEVQPDDADWDAGDIRYNVLRWTSSPTPPFGGYGPSFADPRTGEILGADIMLEWTFITNRLHQEKAFETALLVHEPLPGFEAPACDASLQLHANVLFGATALKALGLRSARADRLLKDSVYYLVLHELGHTLGLNHNMKASHLHAPAALHEAEKTREQGLMGSVMDYPAINVAPLGKAQGEYFATTPGPYDLWAIEYAYSPAASDAAAEKKRLAGILARSAEPALAFGNDADDLRSPGRGIDPRVMINDLSSDPIGYGAERLELIRSLWPKLLDKYRTEGEGWHDLRNGYLVLTSQQAGMLRAISRYIGGVYVDRSVAGTSGAADPLRPVPLADQRRAMKALSDHLFSPAAFEAPEPLLRHLQARRRGFDFFETTEDPKLHARILTLQGEILDFLLDPTTLKRLSDTRLYGNGYSPVAMVGDLTRAIFEGDATGGPSSVRQNLQIDYAQRLARMAEKEAKTSHDHLARSAAVGALRRIRQLAVRPALEAENAAHRDHLRLIVDRALAVS